MVLKCLRDKPRTTVVRLFERTLGRHTSHLWKGAFIMDRFACTHSRVLALLGIIVVAMLFPAVARCRDPQLAGRVTDYLDVLNSGDRRQIRAYITENCDPSFLKSIPIHIHVTIQMGFYYATGGLGYEFHSMRDSQTGLLGAVLRNKLTGSWLDLSILLAQQPPHKINGFPDFEPTSPPPGVQPSAKLSDKEIVQRLEICLKKLVEDDEFSGVVLLAKNGTELFHKAYGLASKSYEVPNRLDTRFNIASVGKVFTGIAITQLAEKKKLSLTDPVSKYLPPDWLNPDISKKIQIQHLLTHTSGLGDYFKKLYGRQTPLVFRNLDDYKVLTADETLAFEPAAQWSYSNTGFLLLGAVLEKVTGQSYFDYVRDHIYAPAGMSNTDAWDKDSPLPNRATGYMKEYLDNTVQWRTDLFTRVIKGMPSGGSFSTAQDLLKFDIALRLHKLLSPEYTKMVLTGKPELNCWHYGYGFFISDGPAGRIAAHGGDGSGISSQFKMYLDSGYTVVVLSNYGPPAATTVEQIIHQMLASQ